MKPLFQYHQEPMTQLQMKFFLGLLTWDDKTRAAFVDDVKKGMPIPWEMFEKHVAAHDIKVAPEILAFILITLEVETPGQIALWAGTLAQVRHTDILTAEDLAYAFPTGFPTKEVYKQAYEENKQNVG